MKGDFVIRIETKRIQYEFTIHRKFTVIQGDSGTGKTTLFNLVRGAHEKAPGVWVNCKVDCVPASAMGDDWKGYLQSHSNLIIFIDEDYKWVRSNEFAATSAKSDNYFVLINRDPLYGIPYSVREIYEIKTSGKFHTLAPVYANQVFTCKPEYILTEDRKSGFQFFQAACAKNSDKCISANGKSNIYKKLVSPPLLGHTVLVVADGAAFGPNIESVVGLKDYMDHKIRIFLPESFEHLLLGMRMFQKQRRVQDVLRHTSMYVGSEFSSWERFFTWFLHDLTEGTPASYSKDSLSRCYIEECCCMSAPCKLLTHGGERKLDSILSRVEGVDFSNFR